MKIIILIPSLKNGGAERVVSRLSNSFLSRGYDVLVVTFSNTQNDYKVKNLMSLGVEASNYFIGKILNSLLRILKLRKIKNDFSPDISISLLFGPNLVNVLSKHSEIIVTSERNALAYEDSSILGSFLRKVIYHFSDYIVANSIGIKNDIVNRFGIAEYKIRVIYNYVDFEIMQKRDLPKNKLTLLTIGRLDESKAQWNLIHTIYQLKERKLNVVLIILGNGKLLTKLTRLVDELNLKNEVKFFGFQTDVQKFLKEADIFCLSSRNEGLPNVLLEAMNAGLPVISTDAPHGPKEILNPQAIDLYSKDNILHHNKYGLLVDYGEDPQSNNVGYYNPFIVNQFVDKILLLINNQSLYQHYSKQSLRRIKDFSETKIINDWIDLFDIALSD